MPSSPVAEPGPAARARSGLRRVGLLGVGLLSIGLLSGCGGGPAPRLFVLEPVASDAGLLPPRSLDALGISVVSLPGYARERRVASRDEGNGVSIDDGHRWAEDPDEAITRLLAERLRAHAGATVLIEPWPRNFAPDARVEIVFDRLLREPSGGADATGQIRLLSGDGRDVLGVESFRLSRPAASAAPADWFGAVSRLVDDLARTAVDALRDDVPS